MATEFSTKNRVRYWKKFSVVLAVGILLLFGGMSINNEYTGYLYWASGIVLVVSAWYGILSVFELFDRVDE